MTHNRGYFPHSLGVFYQALTQYLGFLPPLDHGVFRANRDPDGLEPSFNEQTPLIRMCAGGRLSIEGLFR